MREREGARPSRGATIRGGVVGAARAGLAAVVFLTRVPVPRRPRLGEDDLLAGAVLFPLVGAGLGVMVGGVAAMLATTLPALVAAAFAVALHCAVTGALHLDGLADSADGLAGRDRAQRLTIMRDHALGTYGACALVLDLLITVAALAALADEATALATVAVSAAVFATSRAAPLILAAWLPYARTGRGVGMMLTDRVGHPRALISVALAGAIVLVAAAGAGGIAAVTALACLPGVTLAVGAMAWGRLGGVTGDVMGAAIELTCILGLVLAVGVGT